MPGIRQWSGDNNISLANGPSAGSIDEMLNKRGRKAGPTVLCPTSLTPECGPSLETEQTPFPLSNWGGVRQPSWVSLVERYLKAYCVLLLAGTNYSA